MSIAVQFGNFQRYYMDLLKAPRFPYQKSIRSKGHHNSAKEVLNVFSPCVFNRLCVTHNKHLEQRKFRTKERGNNISYFKSNSSGYPLQIFQILHLRLSTQTVNRKHSVFNFQVALKTTVRNGNSHCRQDFGISENYGCQLQQLMGTLSLPVLRQL